MTARLKEGGSITDALRDRVNKENRMSAVDRFERICSPLEYDAAVSGNPLTVDERIIKGIILKINR